MAHKTLVNGTAYEISGGKTLIGGTAYGIAKGRTLVGSTGYDIKFSLPPAVLDLWGTGFYNKIACVTYTNGYWVVGGSRYDGSQYHASIAYATSLDGDWTIKDIWTGSYANGENNAIIECITYANGYWVVGGACPIASTSAYGCVAYATSLDGTWTIKYLWNERISSRVTSVTYASGYWVAGGKRITGDYCLATIAYTMSLSGNWTLTNVWTSASGYSDSYVYDITYTNGYWVVVGQWGSSTARIAYATSLNGTWTIKDLTNLYPATCITYANGYWVIGGRYKNSTGSTRTYYARIAYATSLDGDWTIKDVWSGSSTSNWGYPSIVYDLTYANGYWVAVGRCMDGTYHARVAYSTSLDGTWTTLDVWSGTSSTTIAECFSVTYADGYWLIGGRAYANSTGHARIAYASTPAELGNTQ